MIHVVRLYVLLIIVIVVVLSITVEVRDRVVLVPHLQSSGESVTLLRV